MDISPAVALEEGGLLKSAASVRADWLRERSDWWWLGYWGGGCGRWWELVPEWWLCGGGEADELQQQPLLVWELLPESTGYHYRCSTTGEHWGNGSNRLGGVLNDRDR